MRPEEVVELLNSYEAENRLLKRQLFEVERDYLIETSDISDKIYLEDEIKKLKEQYDVIDDEPFKFNKNCAKPYEIRSVSPNGVVRTGRKNSKVSWRMKDVREIKAELPPFEEFDSEIFQAIRNKFHTKFAGDVTGRIIYNLYNGTFDDLL